METYTAAQVRAAEEPLLAAGIPLMARAAAALAEETRALLERSGVATGAARVLVLAGSGNNGGDALFAAAQLARLGARVAIAPTSERIHEEGLAAAVAAGAAVIAGGSAVIDKGATKLAGGSPGIADGASYVEQVARVAAESDIILDGILGTGTSANPALRGLARDIVAGILGAITATANTTTTATTAETSSHATAGTASGESGTATTGLTEPLVVAVDLPSGVGADDGVVPDSTVLAAAITVTFGGCKAGLLIEPGARYAGRVIVADIGLGESLRRVASDDASG
ncbi:NAD(P)H-hydrate epimerase [Subtercola lobariae]|uniref:NAD(P)H-hydrate epimerase n=1 Tax=Subtercola lobariae TaxID=1588641 RepID=A0A917EWJ3_9MICO|nr:NAD(P)H-hydrate epimerase [Subtercola lobariae]GGF16570.1 hypothetical protein GCM10011399_07930 [Subtercola lobariae]